MTIKAYKSIKFLAYSGLFAAFVLVSFTASAQSGNLPLTAAADKVALTAAMVQGFYQFNKLEILKGPAVDEAPVTIEVIQKNEKSCVVYENAKISIADDGIVVGSDVGPAVEVDGAVARGIAETADVVI